MELEPLPPKELADALKKIRYHTHGYKVINDKLLSSDVKVK